MINAQQHMFIKRISECREYWIGFSEGYNRWCNIYTSEVLTSLQ